MNGTVIKFAASSLVLGITMVGCKPAADMSRPATLSSKAQQKADQQAAKLHEKALKAVQQSKPDEALALMEKAVELSPRDSGYRMALADLYLRNGRFASAETTFADVVALHPDNHRAGLRLALTQIAQGKPQLALGNLASLEDKAPASDLGLAYALAGNPQRAIELIEPAARAADADGRVRQNLALAYALAGDWAKAKAIAAQDVAPGELDARLAQWATLSDPRASATRVASLLGVSPVQDPGQPVRLALAPAETQATAFAEAEEAEEPAAAAELAAVEPAYTAPAPVEVAAVEAEPAAPINAEAEATPTHYAEVVKSLVEPAAAPAPVQISRVDAPLPAFVPAKAKSSRKMTRFAPGRFVVQIGAFSSAGQVEKAWAQVYRRYGIPAANQPLSTTVRLPGKGMMHRLSIAGFSSRSAAANLCQSIKAKRGACFVRSVAGDAPVQWAWRYTRKA